MQDNELDVGYVAGAHGVNGVVRIKLHDPGSTALAHGASIVLRKDGDDRAAVVEAVDPVPGKAGLYRVQLQGLRFRDEAEALRGRTIVVTRDALPALEDDEYYLADLLGREVERNGVPAKLGTIVGLTSNTAQDLFEVEWVDAQGATHGWLLPVLPGIILETTDARVLVELPPGFLPEALEPSS